MTARDLAVELLRRANLRDVDAALELFHPRAELCFPRFAPRTVYRGGPELVEFFGWLTENLPVQTLAATRVTATDTSATIEFETMGRSQRGHDFDGTGVMIVDSRDGLIEAVRVYIDTADLARVLESADNRHP
jgi:ketosteroid isomerase-like protein